MVSTIDFYHFLTNFRIEKQNEIFLERYLKDVFRELSTQEGNNKEGNAYICEYILAKYLNLPLLITQKICNSLTEKESINCNNFYDFFNKLQSGSFETILKLIFNIYDFNKDGIIYINDCKLVLTHIAFNNDNSLTCYDKVFKRADQLLERIFVKKNHLTFKELKFQIEKRNSDLFLILLTYLLLKLPYNDQILSYYHYDKRVVSPKKRVSWIEKLMVVKMSENCSFFIGDHNFRRIKIFLNSVFDEDELELQRLENDSISDYYDLSTYSLTNKFNNKFTLVPLDKRTIFANEYDISTNDVIQEKVELENVNKL
jgi:hypothetical protein